MTKEQLEGLKEGDVLVWTELRGTVDYVHPDGYADVKFDGSKTLNILEPGTLLLAQVEERTLTGAEVLRMLADGRKPEEFEWRPEEFEWCTFDPTSLKASVFFDGSIKWRVKP